jgi:hypothetical protein
VMVLDIKFRAMQKDTLVLTSGSTFKSSFRS